MNIAVMIANMYMCIYYNMYVLLAIYNLIYLQGDNEYYNNCKSE